MSTAMWVFSGAFVAVVAALVAIGALASRSDDGEA